MIDSGRTPRTAFALVAVALLVLPVGCATTGTHWNPFAQTAPVLTTTADKDEVVAHLNRNVARCTAWQSTRAWVKLKDVPISLQANMAVESPRHFRLIVTAMNADEADFGSNDDRMWFWVRRSPHPHVFTCAHEQLADAQERLPLPFRPDWMMEVLGVIPLNANEFDLARDPNDNALVRLIGEQETACGEPVRRIIAVNLKKGVITEHALYDMQGHLLAEARLRDHRPDTATGVVLPHTIAVSVPDADVEMKLTLGDVTVNPAGISTRMWELPQVAGCPVYDLGAGQTVQR